MKPRTRCPRCNNPLNESGQCGTCASRAALRKTVAVRTQAPLGGIGSPEPAGDELADVPLPDGWEIALEAIEGPNSGNTFQVTRSRVLIGRGNVEVSLADPTISRRHASLEVYGGNCVLLKDLGSTNGTFVNDQRVRFVELEDGDEVRIGRSRMTVTIVAPP